MRSWRRPAVAIGIGLVAADVFMIVFDMGPNFPLVTAAGLLIGITIWFVAAMASVTVGDDNIRTEFAAEPRVRRDQRVAQLHRGIAYSRSDDPLERLRDELIELIDDQLRAVHDIDRTRQPERARAVLGPELERFVSDPSTASSLARPRSLDRIVTRIEQL